MSEPVTQLENIRLGEDGQSVVILDQTLLPNEERYITLRTEEEMFDAIRLLRVRGAPAIGICAGYCLYVLARRDAGGGPDRLLERLKSHKDHLDSSRPTAVNLRWALERMERTALAHAGQGEDAILAAMEAECRAIHAEDMSMCLAISELGLSLLKDGDGILTHCNAGPLATSRYGTALGPILLGRERGMTFHVFSDETRPLLQGARLTSYELYKAGVDVTLICDNMASIVMKNGWINACLVGCDRVAANGDAANKIGTSGAAILAKHYGVPFYVLGPTSTIDMSCPDGDHIPIELRDPAEIREKFYAQPQALPGVKCYNPAFDVTDHSLITAIITEKAICRPPFSQSLAALF